MSKRYTTIMAMPKVHFSPEGTNGKTLCYRWSPPSWEPKRTIKDLELWEATLKYEPTWLCKNCIQEWDKMGRSLEGEEFGMFMLRLMSHKNGD